MKPHKRTSKNSTPSSADLLEKRRTLARTKALEIWLFYSHGYESPYSDIVATALYLQETDHSILHINGQSYKEVSTGKPGVCLLRCPEGPPFSDILKSPFALWYQKSALSRMEDINLLKVGESHPKIKEAVNNARSDCKLSDATDQEILAVFAACETTTTAIYKMVMGEDRDVPIEARIHAAEVFLALAKIDNEQFEKIDLEAMKQSISDSTSTSTPKDTPEPQAQDTSKDIKEIYYDDKEGELFVDKIYVNLTPTEKVFFEYFWDHKNITVTVDDITEHMITSGRSSNASWDRGYFGKTLSSINRKGKSLGVKKLIRNVERGKKEYVIPITVKKKTFEP